MSQTPTANVAPSTPSAPPSAPTMVATSESALSAAAPADVTVSIQEESAATTSATTTPPTAPTTPPTAPVEPVVVTDSTPAAAPKAAPAPPAALAKKPATSMVMKVLLGLFITVTILGGILIGLYVAYKPKGPDSLTLCKFKLCEPLGHPEGSKECSAAVEASARGSDAVVHMSSVLKFKNPNDISADVKDWKMTLQWAASNGKESVLASCVGSDLVTMKAKENVEVSFDCVINTVNNAVTAALEAYWEGAAIGVHAKVEAKVVVLSVPLSISFDGKTVIDRGQDGGKDEKLVFGSDGRVLDGFDAGYEQGLLTGNTSAAPKGFVKFGDDTCPGGTDVSVGAPSLYLCAVWVPDGWFAKVKNCLGGGSGGLGALASAAAALMGGGGECGKVMAEVNIGAQLVVHNPSGFSVGLQNLQLDVFLGNSGLKAGTGSLISGHNHVIPAHSNGTVLATVNVPLGLTRALELAKITKVREGENTRRGEGRGVGKCGNAQKDGKKERKKERDREDAVCVCDWVLLLCVYSYISLTFPFKNIFLFFWMDGGWLADDELFG